jgi:hypothetical protein
MSKMDTRRNITAKLVRKAGTEGRFSAAWEMVAEVDLMRGSTGSVPRLRRDIARLVRLEDADK